jgi:hypothetical protein
MALIATQIEPRRVGRIFFNCRNVAPDPADQRRIERAIKHSIALAVRLKTTRRISCSWRHSAEPMLHRVD